tara:strand:- start:530 stop:874 length:345 start_codon:yes stop_codon:yes gene_type:complete
MTLSKKNLAKLKEFLHNEKNNKNSNYVLNSKTNYFSEDRSFETSESSEIFYSIIDNSDDLEETISSDPKLKKSEEQYFKENSSYPVKNIISSQKNTQLSEEDLLYDEFNYLLDE